MISLRILEQQTTHVCQAHEKIAPEIQIEQQHHKPRFRLNVLSHIKHGE